MKTSVKKTSEKSKEKKEETIAKMIQDDKTKKSTPYSVVTPRNFVQKSTAADIYALKKNVPQSAKTPKKIHGISSQNGLVSPMKDLLKASPSSVSQKSARLEKKVDAKVTQLHSARKPTSEKRDAKTPLHSARSVSSSVKRSTKDLKGDAIRKSVKAKELPMNVTINSPAAKRKSLRESNVVRKLDYDDAPTKKIDAKSLDRGDSKEITQNSLHLQTNEERQRTKTRTLDEKEVKMLKSDSIDNNAEMITLTKKLVAKPKAFYVDLENKKEFEVDDDQYSYEDDFESYESDFDSYHSEGTGNGDISPKEEEEEEEVETTAENKDARDEENMLDSGSYELKESQRSANRFKATIMDFIIEDTEGPDDKKVSLTDEGFQEMSCSSMGGRTHVDVLDRPLFLDFTKGKENKRKRKICEKLKERAKVLLNMISLHEMSYSLFEMKPIPYDLYMATFGRSNYLQMATQTFDDGITEEIQTEEIGMDCKWTQHPVQFSKTNICLKSDNDLQNTRNNNDDFMKFTFLINKFDSVEDNNKINLNKDYECNPLREYLEQKDGVGSGVMLPYETYSDKIKNNDYNKKRLSKFLKRIESRVSHVLTTNAKDKNVTEFTKASTLPYSKGYLTVVPKIITEEKYDFLKNTTVTGLIFSEDKSNLLITVHKNGGRIVAEKCLVCLWDVSVARREPIRVLVAIDDVNIGRFRGASDGIFVTALRDSSIHLWDLSEVPTWRDDVASTDEKTTNLVEIDNDFLSQTEREREWNRVNRHVITNNQIQFNFPLQACAYTNSGANLNGESIDQVVGLEFVGNALPAVSQDGGRKIVGQICSLQRVGVLNIWSIIQEKAKHSSKDIGKAYWSKMKLEKTQTINLLEHLITSKISGKIAKFNLNAAKKRLNAKKLEKSLIDKRNSRPKSAVSEFDRPVSAASSRKVLPVEEKLPQKWENGLICTDLKIMTFDTTDHYLVARNCGEVLCCTKIAGMFKINRFCVSTDTSTISSLEVSHQGLPCFLAATEAGTVHLCSLVENRVLLTLDCRNTPTEDQKHQDKCISDAKGRFVSSATVRSPSKQWGKETEIRAMLPVAQVHWSPSNPCRIYARLIANSLLVWDLARSDIVARASPVKNAVGSHGGTIAILTVEGEVQVHKLSNELSQQDNVDLFNKYITLL